jgi:hypothetical protein
MNFQHIKNTSIAAIATLLAGTFSACTPESSDKDLGPQPVASFTATPVDGKPNKIIVNNTTPGGFLFVWEDDNQSKARRATDTLFYFLKGEYNIQLTVATSGGYAKAAQKVNIANDAPTRDILQGGNMETGSEAFWTVLNTGGTQTGINIAGGVMNFSNAGNTNGAIYQKVTVSKGKFYRLSARVTGKGASNSWFEVYIDKAVPKQGSDYSGNKYISLNTWAGCGAVKFDGNLETIGCDGTGKDRKGVMTFSESGDIYIVLKAGSSGGTLGDGGINIDDIKFLEEI